jgi:hypothetical protein
MNARRPLPTLILIVTLALLVAYVPTAEAAPRTDDVGGASLAPVWVHQPNTGIIAVMIIPTPCTTR